MKILVTGATGMIGRWLLPRLYRHLQPEDSVVCLLRHADKRLPLLEKYAAAEQVPASAPLTKSAKLIAIEADLGLPALGISSDVRENLVNLLAVSKDASISSSKKNDTVLIHLGAAMQLGMSHDDAQRINVQGTQHLLDLADALGMQHIVQISGFRIGSVGDRDTHTNRPADLGAYECSKIDADRLVRAWYQQKKQENPSRQLFLSLIHPSTIMGDSQTGETSLFWGWPDTLRDLSRGKLPLIPACGTAWMPLVSVDYVADFIAAVALQPTHTLSSAQPSPDAETYPEYFVLDNNTPHLIELIQQSAQYLGVKAPKLHLKTEWVQKITGILGRALSIPALQVMAESLSFISTDRYPTASAEQFAAQHQLVMPDFTASYQKYVRYLADANFTAPSVSL